METMDYLDGDLHFQPYTFRSSTEVRLHVLSPVVPGGIYEKKTYDCNAHERCMFYHNSVTRRAHLGEKESAPKGLSFDQTLAHTVLSEWMDRAMTDPDIVVGLTGKDREKRIHEILISIDQAHGRMLAMRRSENLGHIVSSPNFPVPPKPATSNETKISVEIEDPTNVLPTPSASDAGTDCVRVAQSTREPKTPKRFEFDDVTAAIMGSPSAMINASFSRSLDVDETDGSVCLGRKSVNTTFDNHDQDLMIRFEEKKSGIETKEEEEKTHE